MEFFLNRYRNLAVLLLAILAQLVLLAYQVKSNQQARVIRVWAVTAVTPLASGIEAARSSLSHFFSDYFILLDVREENQRMKKDLDRIQMDNQFLRAELSTADRARALAIFQTQSPSKTTAAHIIGNTTDSGAKVVIVDRGSTSGIEKGMAVITPDGIVGKVDSVYPTASFVLLITDPTFAAGVVSQNNQVHGTLKGQGYSTVKVDYVQNEEKVDQDEWFYTSGDDRIFPQGFAGRAGDGGAPRQGAQGDLLDAERIAKRTGGRTDRRGRRSRAHSRRSLDESDHAFAPSSAGRRRWSGRADGSRRAGYRPTRTVCWNGIAKSGKRRSTHTGSAAAARPITISA